jgi:prepilin-type processing-associated H-X9-DG protein
MLMPIFGRMRARAQSLQCQATLRTIGLAGQFHANNHRGYLPVAGMHVNVDLNVPPAEGLGDPQVRRFTYYLDDDVERPVPYTIALAIELGEKVRLDARENLEEDMQKEEVRRHFRCPSQKVELKGLTNNISYWQTPDEWSSYVFGEGVLGTRDKDLPFPRGKVSKVKRPSVVMLAMDGRPRYPLGEAKNWLLVPDGGTQWTLADYQRQTKLPGYDWIGREAIDYLRHDWHANVLFVDGHVESVPLSEEGCRTVGLSKGIYD